MGLSLGVVEGEGASDPRPGLRLSSNSPSTLIILMVSFKTSTMNTVSRGSIYLSLASTNALVQRF
jgi:hypothetical protein